VKSPEFPVVLMLLDGYAAPGLPVLPRAGILVSRPPTSDKMNPVAVRSPAPMIEHKFHIFIERSLHFIGKECFLMAFDDVDTDFSRGWPVLEVIRRYLTSPRWITVVCGDLDLFAILVRGKQWSNFEEKNLKYDDRNLPSFQGHDRPSPRPIPAESLAARQSDYFVATELVGRSGHGGKRAEHFPNVEKVVARLCKHRSAKRAQFSRRVGVSSGWGTLTAAAPPNGASGTIAGP
jgi:hypothetical protein